MQTYIGEEILTYAHQVFILSSKSLHNRQDKDPMINNAVELHSHTDLGHSHTIKVFLTILLSLFFY